MQSKGVVKIFAEFFRRQQQCSTVQSCQVRSKKISVADLTLECQVSFNLKYKESHAKIFILH